MATSTSGKGNKPKLASIKADPADALQRLPALVLAALEDWQQWAPETERGVLTPIQFLAVVLWWLQTDATTPEDDRLIVQGWAMAVEQATRAEILVALHPVTMLAIPATSDFSKWLISINHANAFLKEMPVGFDCGAALEHFRKAAAELASPSTEPLTIEAAVAERRAQSGAPWTDRQREAVQRHADEFGVAKTAEKVGIKRQTLEGVLRKKRSQRGPVSTTNGTVVDRRWEQLGARRSPA